MMMKERKNEFDQQIAQTEYLASFWNYEAVQKIREIRSQTALHAFKDDDKFEQSVLDQSYKNDPLIKAIQRINEMEKAEIIQEHSRDYRNRKSATDLSELSKMIKKKI